MVWLSRRLPAESASVSLLRRIRGRPESDESHAPLLKAARTLDATSDRFLRAQVSNCRRLDLRSVAAGESLHRESRASCPASAAKLLLRTVTSRHAPIAHQS